MRTGVTVDLSDADRQHLAAIVADRNSPQKHVWRAQSVLLTYCRRLWHGRDHAAQQHQQNGSLALAGTLHDGWCRRPAARQNPPLGTEVEQRVVARTLTDPLGETTHWTAGAMATECGISVSSVQRIWRRHGLQPHRTRQFKLCNDPQFAAKLHEIVGLYVDPPAHTVVLSGIVLHASSRW
jgi:hypothetical protein